ncbi:unnamed protein product [Rotaria socialis]|uniref:Uncharacterized protein n=1 Tax=Rotaria socialis TaxID=392032 RepID=A0A818BVR3_9BILA|nr:unnamed protein product [Rotaria socialis]CAF4353500.1 unnamed protein product [Rotaria socialis]
MTEWFTILAIVLLIILMVVLGVLLACMLAGQRCTISVQKRTPNPELTRIQLEKELKKQKKFSSKVKRALDPSSKVEQPLAPVEDVKTVELTFKLGKNENDAQQITTISEPTADLLPVQRISEAERKAREKKREQIRKKYNL